MLALTVAVLLQVAPAEAIGGTSAGCLAGGVELPADGQGYAIAKPERHRVFGHPLLVGFISDLAGAVKKAKLGLLWVGDMSQEGGGPAPSGHASHQTGLDVDLEYQLTKNGQAVAMADAAKNKLTKAWNKRVPKLLALAAADPRVDRIFVNPAIKQALCAAKDDRAWLHKIRPWWGHHDHFHVRLACPADSKDCERQATLPDGDGCAELDWWFSEKAQEERKETHGKYQAKVGAKPPLPARCAEIAPTSSGK